MRVVFVHGACVKDGAWWWHRTAQVLAAAGIRSDSALLPSCGETGSVAGGEGPGFPDDVNSVRALLTGSDEPTVVVAHSYGGIVTAEAADGIAAVSSLLYVSSYLPQPGESLATFAGPEPAPFLVVDPAAGTFAVRPEAFVDTFMADCPADVIAESPEHLAVQSLSVTGHAVTRAAWHDVPTTYVVCAADRGTPAERQRSFAERATRVVEIDSGHHPFLSRPDEMAAVVRELG